MTNYIEEMMRTAGVIPISSCEGCTSPCLNMDGCWKPDKYPDFTPEKQLEVIKLIIDIQLTDFGIDMDYKQRIEGKDFVQALAQLTTELMKAGELDKEKVKEVLKG